MQPEQPLGEHARRVARTYGAAADHHCLPALGFRDRFGAETVSRLRLTAGLAVLDLCCGAGASAVPAAHAVGPAGRVLGIDVAEPLLELARGRAAREGLANADFRRGDATRTGLSEAVQRCFTSNLGNPIPRRRSRVSMSITTRGGPQPPFRTAIFRVGCESRGGFSSWA